MRAAQTTESGGDTVAKPSDNPEDPIGGLTLPEPVHRSSAPLRLDLQGWWLILGDIHIPFHDARVRVGRSSPHLAV